MRVTYHNGRSSKKGAYLAQHNDRSGGLGAHIDSDRSAGNRYWAWDGEKDFATSEQAFYEQNFNAALADRNARYERQRHPERVQDMTEYRRNPRSCPEETIWQIGKLGDSADPDTLWGIVCDVLNWQAEEYPLCKVLDVALHVDEEGAPHVHVRQVWLCHDKEGHSVVGQNASLREMGIDRPDPTKKEGRYNNAKQTFTSSVRERLQSVARRYGIEIEDVPRERSQSGLSLVEYQARQEEIKARDAQETARKAQEATWTAEAEEAKHRAGAEVWRAMERTAEAVAKTNASLVVDVVKTIPARKGIFGIGKRPEMVVVEAGELAQVQTGAELREGMQTAARELQASAKNLRSAARDRHISSHEIDLQRIEIAEFREAQANRRAMEAENAARAAEARAKAAEMAAERERQRADKLSAELADARDLLAWSNPDTLRAVRKYAKQQRITDEIQRGLGHHRTAEPEHERMERAIEDIL